MKVFKLATGLAVGYVLGSRAGRDKYNQIVAAARKAQDHPTVAQVERKAKGLLGTTGSSLATGTDPVPVQAPTTSATTNPTPRPPRRQLKNAPTTSGTAIDPLA